MQAHQSSHCLDFNTEFVEDEGFQENTIYFIPHCNTQQVLITLLFQLIRMPLMPQWLWAHLPTLFSSHLFKKPASKVSICSAKTVFQIDTGSFLPEYEMNSQTWPSWISDTNCSENIRRIECLVYHWTKFISFDTLELTLVQIGAILPVHVKRYNGFNFLHKCVCVFCSGTCQTELIQGPLKFLWLKWTHNSSRGPSTHSNRGGCCCCFLYSWNKTTLDWYFIHFNLGED